MCWATMLARSVTSSWIAWQVAFLACEVERDAGAVPDVVGRAPPTGIELVVDLERDLPRIAGVLGDRQPHPRREHRPAGEAFAVAVQQAAHRLELVVELGGAAADHRVGSRERGEHRSEHLHVGRPLAAEVGFPDHAVEQ